MSHPLLPRFPLTQTLVPSLTAEKPDWWAADGSWPAFVLGAEQGMTYGLVYGAAIGAFGTYLYRRWRKK